MRDEGVVMTFKHYITYLMMSEDGGMGCGTAAYEKTSWGGGV